MSSRKYLGSVALVALLSVSGCSSEKSEEKTTEQAESNVKQQTESQKLNDFFEQLFMKEVMDSPESQAYLGIKKDIDKWTDRSPERELKDHQDTLQALKDLKNFDFEKLDKQTKLSYRLFERDLNSNIEGWEWRDYNYPVNQMFGWHSGVITFMINLHRVDDVKDAEAYITRLNGLHKSVGQRLDRMRRYQEKGILPPKFVFPHVLRDIENITKGVPFTEGEDSTLLADFKKKVIKLKLGNEKTASLISQAKQALLTSVKPAYADLKTLVEAQMAAAPTDDGVWRLPKGGEFYNYRLREITTTTMTADDIHDLGLKEVDRIHGQMRKIMAQVGFKGDLQAFFDFTQTDKQFFYADTAEGKKAYLDKATDIINIMKSRLDDVFITKPKADLEVKAVEAFREQSAGKAFYNQPAMDGSRPGYYYANLYKMSSMPKYEMEALAYHEGIPGHHMQIAINQELEGLPKFRKYGGYTSYVEGWGLYSEFLPKEMGFYQDPYSDFGRLAMELWRACRLVVDTGIHSKKWSREKAIEYLDTATPNDRNDVVKAIERYIVMPAQATAYKIGMIKILTLRENAKKELGEKFDIREYHEVVLKDGAVPLSILEENVKSWIDSKK